MSASRQVAILTYHSIDDSGSVLSTSPAAFREQMRILHELRLPVVPLEDVPRHLEKEEGPGRMVAITFDDGFRNVHEHALPVQQRYGFPATVFLVTDYCGRTNEWPGQTPGIDPRPLLRWDEVRELGDAGFTFGSHTRTHRDLTRASPEEAEQELVSSKEAIQEAIGRSPETHAYPYGACDATVREIAGRHFRLACSTTLAYAGSDSDLYALERLDMYYLRSPALFRRLFSVEMGAYMALRRRLRDLRARALASTGER